MQITEVEIENATSFGSAGAILRPLHPVNALIGRNNAGKSNVFRMIDVCRRQATSNPNLDMLQLPLRERTWHMGIGADTLTVRLSVEFNTQEREELGLPADSPATFQHVAQMTPKVVDGKWWCSVEVPGDQPGQADHPTYQEVLHVINRQIKWIPPLRHLAPENAQNVPNAALSHDGTAFKTWLNDVLSGKSRMSQKIAETFHNDIRSIDGFEEVTMSVAAGDQGALVVLVSEDSTNFKTPIDECGAGLQMVAILLSAQHMTFGAVLLVDDVDNNLYPLAQQDLCRVLMERAAASGGQVIYTTHSPAMLDKLPNNAVFEITRCLGVSSVSSIGDGTNKLMESLKDLGYRPSLLRLADAIVFVEGSSDEAIVRAWWQTIFGSPPDPAIVFLHLGGTNMTRLTAAAVQGLGRDVFILVDSDRAEVSAPISQQAQLVINQVGSVANVHVLERRTIESYFSIEAVQKVLHTEGTVSLGPYDKLSDAGVNYGKTTHGARVAASMPMAAIPEEIVNFLTSIRDSTRSSVHE